MTSDKARKHAIRARMAATGEPYSVAARALGATSFLPARRTATVTVYRIVDSARSRHDPRVRWQTSGVGGDPLSLDSQDLTWPAGVDDRDRDTFLRLVQQGLGERGWDVRTPPDGDPVTDRDVVELELVRNELGLELDRLPVHPPCLHSEPAARARSAELMRRPKAELAAWVVRGVLRPDGATVKVVDSQPHRWRKDELVTHILHIERPDLPWAMIPYNHGRLDQVRGTVDAARFVGPDYKLGVAHQRAASEQNRTAAADEPVALAGGEPWLRAVTWHQHWRAWFAANDEDDRDQDDLGRALAILMDNQAAWFDRWYLPSGCRWAHWTDTIVGPAGTVLPPGLAEAMQTVAAGVEKAAYEILSETLEPRW